MDNKRNDNKNNDPLSRSTRRSRLNEGGVQRRSSRTGSNTGSRRAKDDLLFPQTMRTLYSEEHPVANGVYANSDTDTESIADIMTPHAYRTSNSNKATRTVRSSSAPGGTHGTHIRGSRFENPRTGINSGIDTEPQPIIRNTSNTRNNAPFVASSDSASGIKSDYRVKTDSVFESSFASDRDSDRGADGSSDRDSNGRADRVFDRNADRSSAGDYGGKADRALDRNSDRSSAGDSDISLGENSDRGSESESGSSSRRRRSSGTYYRDNIIQDDGHGTHGKRKNKQDDLSANSISAGGFSRESHKKQANIKELIKIFSVLIVILAIIIGAIIFYQKLHVSTISVIGSHKYSEKQLISESGIQDGAFILSYSEEDIYALFGKIDDISVIGFKRIYPDKLEIRVADRDARAAIPAGNGKYTIISADGYVIGSNAESSEGLIVIRGLAGKSYAVGSCIDDDTQSASELAVIELLEGVSESELASIVTAIDLSNTSCIKFEIGDKFTIVLGDCIEASQNIDTASKAYAIFSRSYPAGGVINVFSNSTIVDFTPASPAVTDTAEP